MKAMVFAVLAGTALFASPVYAQYGQGSPPADKTGQPQLIQSGFVGISRVLIENADVQKDLKVTPEQARKIGELAKEIRKADQLFLLRIQADLTGTPPTPEQIKATVLAEWYKKLIATHEKDPGPAVAKYLTELLTAEQNKRLAQLDAQARGPFAFLDGKIAGELGITEVQRAAIAKELQESNKKKSAIFKDAKGENQKAQKKIAELHRGLTADFVKMLTPAQEKIWQSLVGEPFEGALPSSIFGWTFGPGPVMRLIPGS
jgi:hypothetical protein